MRKDVGPRAKSPLLRSPKGKEGGLTLSYSLWRDQSGLTDCDAA